MTLDLERLKQILGLVREHDLSEFELEQDGLRLKVIRESLRRVAEAPPPPPASPATEVAARGGSAGGVAAASSASGPISRAPAESEIELAVVKSPIVGTFYRSSEPEAAPFIEIGSSVKKGQVICIIEAMKLMNEIDSEFDGEVVSIYVENGQPVQFGERLFAIKTT